MGLDMYAYTAPAELVGDQQVDIEGLFVDGERAQGVDSDFAYWRKFNALHGWMEKLYRSKGGKSETFNCNTVRLTSEDLGLLYAALMTGGLEPRSGFFFGPPTIYPEDVEATEAFIKRAFEAIKEGKAVIYNSWW